MGIRFRCHLCHTELHVKDLQAGKRGRCPTCNGSFRVPLEDAEYSLRPEDRPTLPVKSLEQPNAAVTPDRREDQAEAARGTPIERPTIAQSSSIVPPHPLPPAAPPRAIAEVLSASWYVRSVSGVQYGPAPGQVVWQWLLENRIGADSLVWREDWPEWLLASSVFREHFQGVLHDNVPVTVGTSQTTSPPRNTTGLETASLETTSPAGPTLPTAQPEKAGSAALAITTTMPTIGQKNREFRKQKRQRNYTLMIVGLILILLILLAGLIAVLVRQNSGTALLSASEIVAVHSTLAGHSTGNSRVKAEEERSLGFRVE